MVNIVDKIKKSHIGQVAVFAATLTASEIALAGGGGGAGGLGGIQKIFTSVESALTTIAVVVLTVAFIVAGYKVVFGGRTIQEVAPILIGGVIIGAASYLAGLVLGK